MLTNPQKEAWKDAGVKAAVLLLLGILIAGPVPTLITFFVWGPWPAVVSLCLMIGFLLIGYASWSIVLIMEKGIRLGYLDEYN